MIFFIPGYLLISVLFPNKEDLGNFERIAFSFGISIAVVPLLGLLLNFTLGIRLNTILSVLFIYTIILSIIAIYRRNKLSEDSRFKVQLSKIHDIINNDILDSSKNKTDKILTIILIFSMIIALSMVIYIIATPKVGEKFTEFYILNSTTGMADNYPTRLNLNNDSTLLVGVVNHEYYPVNYTLQIVLGKDTLSSEKLMLNNNETWEKIVSFVPNQKGIDMKLSFLLFKEDNYSIPYRELHLWVSSV